MAMHTGEPMPYRTADTRDLVAVQRAMARMAGYLAAVTPAVTAGDVVAAGTVADLATELADAVRRLDAVESELLWPVLRAYLLALDATDEANELIRIDGQGERLVHLIEQTAIIVARFRATATADDRETLAELFLELRTAMTRHFGDMQRAVLPLAERYMTCAQWQEIGKQFLLGVSDQRRTFRMGAMLLECSRRDRARVVRSCDGRRSRLSRGRVRRAFVREFGRIQDVLGEEPVSLAAAR